jgi:hypothetical protein
MIPAWRQLLLPPSLSFFALFLQLKDVLGVG